MFVDELEAINTVIKLAKIFMKVCLIFKEDFEKAYDSFNWDFWITCLSYLVLMRSRGLDGSFMFVGNLIVLVNGFLTQDISIQWGLK